MSRITQSIINSAFDLKISNILTFFDPNKLDLNVLNLKANIHAFRTNQFDINNKINVINENDLNSNLVFLPDIVICCFLPEYSNAKNISSALKLPLINILDENSINVKKESILDLSRLHLLNDINIVYNQNIAYKLYISNYSLIEKDLEAQIYKLTEKWIPN